ncbi:UDP-glucose 4-epimerase [Dissulfuribacter thermophilus]|uniref:UDP-glucose 4-epimerase n=1 Tax=Dissulfuribacter thermophilus TaxID=1156395 RepID=A0A1B9F4C4_9BACT|nr:NAD-dependent epimerase/dehydratase family protein [Dissulfuribacter thermophilus]OCC14674.1 UDP-glucose 4-epimerase [Dissulfuribacter thermophilus]
MNITTQSSSLSPQSKQPTHWLITGGCGFIGTSLVKRLVEEGRHFVRVVDNLSVGSREDLARVCHFTEISPSSLSLQHSVLSPNTVVELCVGDILDEKLAMQVTQGMDVIVHLAANTGVAPSVENPRMDCMTNVIGTLNYLEAARLNSVQRFVFASSGAPVGEVDPPIHEELAPHPVSPYGASKLAGEGYCSAYYRTYGVETVALRFGNVYGPGSGHKSSVVAKFIKRALNSEELEIYGDGKQTRDFIYIDDLIEAIWLAAIKKNIGGEIFQIASNAETTVVELSEKLIGILKKYGVKDITVVHRRPRLGDVRRNYSSTTKARDLLGWTPQYELDKGLDLTVDYFLKKIINDKQK